MMTTDYFSSVLSQTLLDQESIQKRVEELGREITRDFKNSLLCLCPLLNGGMIFAADLMREIALPLTLLPLKAASYGDGTKSSGSIDLPWGIPGAVAGKNILVVDDILDTGYTLQFLKRQLLDVGALSVSTCVLLHKEHAKDLPVDYSGFEIPNQFVVGYGLDFAGQYRNLPCIGIPRVTDCKTGQEP